MARRAAFSAFNAAFSIFNAAFAALSCAPRADRREASPDKATTRAKTRESSASLSVEESES